MENKIIKSSMGFYSIGLKVANMRNVQNFSLYPDITSTGEVWLQSSKRFIAVNVNDGKAIINKSNKNYATRYDLILGGIIFDFDKDVIAELKNHYENHKVGTNQVKSGDTVLLTY